MERDGALAQLGLHEEATKSEIEEAHRRLAREAHPDVGGSNERMARLNEARDTALATVQERALKEVVMAIANVDVARAGRESNRAKAATVVGGITRAHVGRLKLRAIACGVASLAGWAWVFWRRYAPIQPSDALTPLFYVPLLWPFIYAIESVLILVATILVVVAITSAFQVFWMTHALDIATTALNDKEAFVNTLSEITDGAVLTGTLFSRSALRDAVASWCGRRARAGLSRQRFVRIVAGIPFYGRLLRLTSREFVPKPLRLLSKAPAFRDLAFWIGEVDFTELLIVKGVEHDWLDSKDEIGGGRIMVQYSLRQPDIRVQVS